MFQVTTWTVLSLLVSSASAYNGNYNCASGTDAVVHLFEWKYSDIERECSWLASKGYCAVQVTHFVHIAYRQ